MEYISMIADIAKHTYRLCEKFIHDSRYF